MEPRFTSLKNRLMVSMETWMPSAFWNFRIWIHNDTSIISIRFWNSRIRTRIIYTCNRIYTLYSCIECIKSDFPSFYISTTIRMEVILFNIINETPIDKIKCNLSILHHHSAQYLTAFLLKFPDEQGYFEVLWEEILEANHFLFENAVYIFTSSRGKTVNTILLREFKF